MLLFVPKLSHHMFRGLMYLTVIYTTISSVFHVTYMHFLFLLRLCYVEISGVRVFNIIINLAATLHPCYNVDSVIM